MKALLITAIISLLICGLFASYNVQARLAMDIRYRAQIMELKGRVAALEEKRARDTLQLHGVKQNINVMFVTPLEFVSLQKLMGEKKCQK